MDRICISPGCQSIKKSPSHLCAQHAAARRRLSRDLDREARWAAIKSWPRRFWCRLFGHRKPYVERLTASQCGRCGIVVQSRSRLVIPISRLK